MNGNLEGKNMAIDVVGNFGTISFGYVESWEIDQHNLLVIMVNVNEGNLSQKGKYCFKEWDYIRYIDRKG